MTSHRSDIPSVSDICAHVEHLGYATSRHICAITEQEKAFMDKSKDQDRGKGAMEQDEQNQGGNLVHSCSSCIAPGCIARG
jgi:hypothetical protein